VSDLSLDYGFCFTARGGKVTPREALFHTFWRGSFLISSGAKLREAKGIFMLRKLQQLMFVVAMIATVVLSNIPGVADTKPLNLAQNTSPQPPAPKGLSISDLKKLRWIEGTWRGTGDVQSPFFEKYYFENDSVLVVESFPDEALSKIDDVTRFELREAQFGNWGEGSRWLATQLDTGSITFEPAMRARNKFRWERESQDVWIATLSWPATESSPARQRVYRMERLRQSKQ
jgi:hypothetical protein